MSLEALKKWLEEHAVPYEVVEHPEAFAALDEATAAGAEPHEAAKTLALHDRDGYRLAVIPATARLDVGRARELLGATSHLRLATEEELASDFSAYEVGALPPLGPMLPSPEVVDVRLLYRTRLVCSAGDHRHSVVLPPRELVRVAEPVVGDICEHHTLPHDEDFAQLPKP